MDGFADPNRQMSASQLFVLLCLEVRYVYVCSEILILLLQVSKSFSGVAELIGVSVEVCWLVCCHSHACRSGHSH